VERFLEDRNKDVVTRRNKSPEKENSDERAKCTEVRFFHK
jgi:hypothetical protein